MEGRCTRTYLPHTHWYHFSPWCNEAQHHAFVWDRTHVTSVQGPDETNKLSELIIVHLLKMSNFSSRLWICNKTPADNPEPQQIGYYNVVPVCTDAGGGFSKPQFEDIHQTLDRFNRRLAQNPIQGKATHF